MVMIKYTYQSQFSGEVVTLYRHPDGATQFLQGDDATAFIVEAEEVGTDIQALIAPYFHRLPDGFNTGPWHAQRNDAGDGFVVKPVPGYVIADVEGTGPLDEYRAKLFATAPELLATGKAVLAWLALHMEKNQVGGDVVGMRDQLRRCVQRVEG